MLSLELSLAPPPVPPSPSQEASTSERGELCLELCLWPASGRKAAATQKAEEEKNDNTKAGSVDTAYSSTLPPGRQEDDIQSRNRWQQEEVDEDEDEGAEEEGGSWEWEEKVWAMTNGTATAPERVLEKKLYATDVSAGHSRLLLAENMDRAGESKRKGPKLLLNLLTDEEKATAGGRDDGGGLPVLLLDRRGREYPLAKLKLWKSSDSYVLIGKWTELVRRNELDPGDVIDMYLFRHGGGVGLVVCPRVSASEEERRRRDDRVTRKRRREEKGDQMRGHKRRRGSCH